MLELLVAAPLVFGATVAAAQSESNKEAECNDRVDNDRDGLADCLDADCYADPACKSGGGFENTDSYCNDGIDNDGDGFADCEDIDCYGPLVKVCQGSWQGPLTVGGGSATTEVAPAGSSGQGTGGGTTDGDVPELLPGMSIQDLLGKGGDADGERNDFVCADGYDNDNDGKTDCDDFGCRFDPQVTVCSPHLSGIRFSVWAHVAASYDFDPQPNTLELDTLFNRVQLRSFGQIPFVQDSFFLLSIRAERTPRLTFATFQLPLGSGHYVVINSGGGGLSNGLILGTQKDLLLDKPFYLYSAFEAGNGASVEFNGPIIPGKLEYRAFASGGAGNFNGNIGGRFFRGDNFNYTWGVGAQVGYYPVGRFDRWDSRFILRPTPTALGLYLGARYDQRADERFPAVNMSALFRSGYFVLTTELWGKRELEFQSWQGSYNITFGALAIPDWLMFAADFGQFLASDFENLPPELAADDLDQDLRRQTNQTQWRVAAHFYAYKNNGVISLLYTDNLTENFDRRGEDRHERQLRLEARLGF